MSTPEAAKPAEGTPAEEKPAVEGEKKEKKGKGKGVEGYRLNVKNIPDEYASAEKLKALFAPFGTVADAQVKTKDDGSSRGFGYVVLKDEAEGEKAIKALNDTELEGKKLAVGPAERRQPDGEGRVGEGKASLKGRSKGGSKGGGKGSPPNGPSGFDGYRLNVKNIPDELATSEKLKELFAPFGTVSDAQIKTKDDGSSRGFGYVVLKDKEEGDKAVKDLNEKEFGGKKLFVGPAERRSLMEDEYYGGGKGAAAAAGGKGFGKASKGKGAGKYDAGFNQQTWVQQQAYATYMNSMIAYQQAYMQQAYMQQWSISAAGQVEYEGSLKSISERNGYGFIVCAETHRLYERDIYVDKEVLPEGAEPGDRLKFAVGMNAKNHPKAISAAFAINR